MPATARFAIWILVAFLLAGCASLTRPWEAPEVALAGVSVGEIGLARQTFVVTLSVRNPNDRALPIEALTYRLSLEGVELAQGSSALESQIPAFGEAMVDVEVVSSLLGVAGQLPAMALKDSPLEWQVTGTATLTGGLLRLPYRYSGEIDPARLLSGAVR